MVPDISTDARIFAICFEINRRLGKLEAAQELGEPRLRNFEALIGRLPLIQESPTAWAQKRMAFGLEAMLDTARDVLSDIAPYEDQLNATPARSPHGIGAKAATLTLLQQAKRAL